MSLVFDLKLDPLSELIMECIDNLGHDTMREFGKSLTKDQLKIIPDMATCDLGWIISCLIETLQTKNIKVMIGKTLNPWSSAMAWTYGKDITFNIRKKHSRESIIKTLVHELVHIAENYDNHSFGHGSNFNQDLKQGCAPMLVSNLFWDYLRSKNGIF